MASFGIFGGQNLRHHFNNRDRHIHLVHDLGEFHTDNTAADNEHALGKFLKIQGLIGSNAVVNTVNRYARGHRTGGDDDLVALDLFAALIDLNRVCIDDLSRCL